MKKVIIQFPQIVIEEKIIEVTEDQHEELLQHSSDIEKTDFIWENMTQQEQDWTNGKNSIESAVDVGYCGIKDSK